MKSHINQIDLDIFNTTHIDHYAVIIYDIEKSCHFHVNVLGFSIIKSYKLKTSQDSTEKDSLSIILEKKINSKNKIICVLNTPLNNKSFLNPYLQKYGEGIHHVAYAVSDIETAFENGLKNNITFTPNQILDDKYNNLRQIFIDKSFAGYFIELIQREKEVTEESSKLFAENNIKELMIASAKNL